MRPENCPRWETCSANICPLDPDWPLRTHLDGERVCLYLTELAKPGGKANLRGVLAPELVEAIATLAPAISASWHRIEYACKRASATGSRITSAKRMRNRRQPESMDDATRPPIPPRGPRSICSRPPERRSTHPNGNGDLKA